MNVVAKLLVALQVGSVLTACGGPAAAAGDSSGDSLVGLDAVQKELAVALSDTSAPPGVMLKVSVGVQTGQFQIGYGRALVQQAAICAWFRYWLTGLSSDDTKATKQAATAAGEFKTWATYTEADQSFRDVIDAAITKTKLGDPSPMRGFVTNNCPAGDVP